MKAKKAFSSKKLLVLTLFTLLLPVAFAQVACEDVWSQTFGGAYDDVGYSVQQTTPDGGYIITGGTTSFGAGNEDVWLIKTDSSGNEEWNRTFGGAYDDVGYSVQQTTPDGGYIITGVSYVSSPNYNQLYLIKTDSGGDIVWSRKLGGEFFERGNAVQQTEDGDYIIAGANNLFDGEDEEVWLIKRNSDGTGNWSIRHGGTGGESGWSVKQTFDSAGNPTGYIIAGYTHSFGALGRDIWLIKTDLTGQTCDYESNGSCEDSANPTEKFARIFGGLGDESDKFISAQQTFDSAGNPTGYIIVGTFQQAGGWVLWLIKTDLTGRTCDNYATNNGNCFESPEKFAKTFQQSSYIEEGFSVQQTFDSEGGLTGYVLAGRTYTGDYNAWLIKTDLSGDTCDYTSGPILGNCFESKEKFVKMFGGSDEDGVFSVQQTADEGYIMAGYTYSFGGGGSWEDAWLIKTDAYGNGPGDCAGVCGDGTMNSPGEECDDEVTNPNDDTYYDVNPSDDDGSCVIDDQRMPFSCKNNVCGDGYLWSGREDCDDGNLNNTDQCSDTCTLTYCGDGIIQDPNGYGESEQCDPPGPGCDSTCQIESLPACGDGFCDTPTENCTNCPSDCGACPPSCGNGILDPGEECETGNPPGSLCTVAEGCVVGFPPNNCTCPEGLGGKRISSIEMRVGGSPTTIIKEAALPVEPEQFILTIEDLDYTPGNTVDIEVSIKQNNPPENTVATLAENGVLIAGATTTVNVHNWTNYDTVFQSLEAGSYKAVVKLIDGGSLSDEREVFFTVVSQGVTVAIDETSPVLVVFVVLVVLGIILRKQ